MKTKYIFVTLEIKNREHTYASHTVHKISSTKNTQKFGDNCAKTFYKDMDVPKDGWYYFYCREIAIRLKAAIEITKEEYEVLDKFLRKKSYEK